jgi:phage terminase large subunit-like protein
MNDGYLGNPLLKKGGTPIEWTADLLKEYMKCAEDPIYFAENYIKIVHVDRGFIPIELYDFQKDIVKSISKHRRVVVNASRQAGKTTTAVAIILHYILFNEYKTVALLANKAASALEILNRIQMAFEALPDWLQQGVVTWNKGSMELENGCKVIAAASSSSSIRGKSIAFLYIDETAFLNNWEEFFASVYPTISSGKETKILLTSTPNSLNHFWKICKEAQEDVNDIGQGKNGYIYKEVRWNDVPGRDEAWKEDTLASISWNMEQFSQEFDCVTSESKIQLLDTETNEILTLTIGEAYDLLKK